MRLNVLNYSKSKCHISNIFRVDVQELELERVMMTIKDMKENEPQNAAAEKDPKTE